MKRIIDHRTGAAVLGLAGAALLAAGSGGAAAPGAPLDPAAIADRRVADDECHWRFLESVRACDTPIQECPNGPCTLYGTCSVSEFRPPCPSILSAVIVPGGEWCRTMISCSEVLPLMVKARCTCAKGIFGCCLSECQPSGGDSGQFACPGTIVTLSSPDD